MSQKFEREIEEILQKEGEFLAGPPRSRPPRRRRPGRRGPSLLLQLATRFVASTGAFMLGSIALALVALLLWNTAASFLGQLLVLAAVTLFLASYAVSFIKPPAGYEKRWRGEVIPPSQPAWMRRVSSWFRRRQ